MPNNYDSYTLLTTCMSKSIAYFLCLISLLVEILF